MNFMEEQEHFTEYAFQIVLWYANEFDLTLVIVPVAWYYIIILIKRI